MPTDWLSCLLALLESVHVLEQKDQRLDLAQSDGRLLVERVQILDLKALDSDLVQEGREDGRVPKRTEGGGTR